MEWLPRESFWPGQSLDNWEEWLVCLKLTEICTLQKNVSSCNTVYMVIHTISLGVWVFLIYSSIFPALLPDSHFHFLAHIAWTFFIILLSSDLKNALIKIFLLKLNVVWIIKLWLLLIKGKNWLLKTWLVFVWSKKKSLGIYLQVTEAS